MIVTEVDSDGDTFEVEWESDPEAGVMIEAIRTKGGVDLLPHMTQEEAEWFEQRILASIKDIRE